MKSEWTPLATDFFRHPAVLAVSPPAKLLFIVALCYCQRDLNDGEFPTYAVRVMAAEADIDPTCADELVEVGLWVDKTGGYAIPGWAEWNKPAEQVKRRRQLDRERKAAARAQTSARTSAGRPADVCASASTSAPTTENPSSSSTTSPGAPPPVDDDDRVRVALEVVADRKTAQAEPRNPKAYRARCLANFEADGVVDEAKRRLVEYPDLTAAQLADVLLGNTTILATARRAPMEAP